MPTSKAWIMECFGVFLYESDVEILSGSINRKVRTNPEKDILVKQLYRQYMGLDQCVNE
jgi:hypothetical protein